MKWLKPGVFQLHFIYLIIDKLIWLHLYKSSTQPSDWRLDRISDWNPPTDDFPILVKVTHFEHGGKMYI